VNIWSSLSRVWWFWLDASGWGYRPVAESYEQTFRFRWKRAVSWLSYRLLVPQEWLYSMEMVEVRKVVKYRTQSAAQFVTAELGHVTRHPDGWLSWVSSVPLDQCRDTLKYASTVSSPVHRTYYNLCSWYSSAEWHNEPYKVSVTVVRVVIQRSWTETRDEDGRQAVVIVISLRYVFISYCQRNVTVLCFEKGRDPRRNSNAALLHGKRMTWSE